MLHKLFNTSLLLLCAQGWALNCSSPVTISDPRLQVYGPDISSNEKGDALLSWTSVQENGESGRFEASYKTENSPWSLPVSLSNWEIDVHSSLCFVNAKGDLFVTWETEKGNHLSFHIAEKIGDAPWNFYPDWISSSTDLDTGFDSIGNLTFIGKKTVPCTPKPYTYPTTIPAIVLSTKSPSQTEQRSDISLPDPACHTIDEIKIAMNKKGVGYAFWASYATNKYLLMGQKIIDNHFVLEPEVICTLKDYTFWVDASLNEEEDIVVAFRDQENNINLITRTQNSWSQPFLFAHNDEEYLSGLCTAIDSSGNMMVTYETETSETDAVNAIYKPLDGAWQNPILLSVNDGLNFNPEIKPDGAGNFIAIWQQKKRQRHAVFGRVFSTTTQTWSEPQRLSSPSESCFGYSYTFFAPGKGYIAWTMSPNGYDEVIQVAELFHESN